VPTSHLLLRVRFFALLSLASSCFIATSARAADSTTAADPFVAKLQAFTAKHCAACHGIDVQERGLRFDKLAVDFDESEVAAHWVKVLDRLARGEMPPADEPQPPAQELKSVVADLRQHLHDASLARQRRDGRVVLRRLNRNEYETTLQDLLGDAVEVRDLLPEDNIAAGFDNVSAVLDVSSVHLLRYQEAAERALKTVIPQRPPIKFHKRHTGRQIVEEQKQFKDLLDKSVELEGDSLVMYVRPWGHIPCATPPVPQRGRYRIKASVRALNTDGKSLPLLCSCRDFYGRSDDDVRAVHDIPPDQSTIVEGEFDLKQRQVIVYSGWTLPSVRDFTNEHRNQSLAVYKGPAMVVEWVEVEGPLDVWPPQGYTRMFGDLPLEPRSVAKAIASGKPKPTIDPKRLENNWSYDFLTPATATPREDAARLMKQVLPELFRRPVDDTLVAYYVKIVHDALAAERPFADAMLLGYRTALCSPHFLYLTEPTRATADETKAAALDDYAIAARLSYCFWSSTPDRELLELAAKGTLSRPEVLKAQVERLLADPKGKRFAKNFAGQWLELRNINATTPDPQLYGEFDEYLFWSMPRETELFFDEILAHDRSVADFVDSDWMFINERLAKHYGIKDVVGGELRKIAVPAGSHRGGVMTQAAILKITADGTKTSPILRGKWVLDRILGQPPSPPPPNISGVEPDIRGATTIRQQLDKHRTLAACASCHKHIDPPGFALENFDVIGGWREFYRGSSLPGAKRVPLATYPERTITRGLDVEQGYETSDGRKFKDVDEYKKLLLADKDLLARNLARKLIVFSTGADIQFADREVLDELTARSREKNYGLRSLVHDVVQSRVFLSK
jgi:mono/diheme cytochrome c family protein